VHLPSCADKVLPHKRLRVAGEQASVTVEARSPFTSSSYPARRNESKQASPSAAEGPQIPGRSEPRTSGVAGGPRPDTSGREKGQRSSSKTTTARLPTAAAAAVA